MESVYNRLRGSRPFTAKEYYDGVYHGEPIRFDRNFRGYRFNDAECAALCNGEWIEVHGLRNNTVMYGVQGCLQEDVFASVKSDVPVYQFKVRKSLVNNPSYDFQKRELYFGPDEENAGANYEKNKAQKEIQKKTHEKVEQPPIKPKMILHQSLVDEFSNEDDAKLAAMLAAPELPPVVKISVPDENNNKKNEVPIFVPVLAGYRFTAHGLEMVADEQAMVETIQSAFHPGESLDANLDEDEKPDPILSDTALVEGLYDVYDGIDEASLEGFAEENEAAMNRKDMDGNADDMLPFE